MTHEDTELLWGLALAWCVAWWGLILVGLYAVL